jgi:hypothetical protein
MLGRDRQPLRGGSGDREGGDRPGGHQDSKDRQGRGSETAQGSASCSGWPRRYL